MTDLERAKQLFDEKKLSVAIVRGEYEYVSEGAGVAPLLHLLRDDPDGMRGASAADKIIGRASALLMIKGGIAAVYGGVMSEGAAAVFTTYDIPFSYGTLTHNIINRAGTDICPMEKCIAEISDPDEAYTALTEKHRELQASRGK